MSTRWRILAIASAALAFGVLAAWAKGPDTNGVDGVSQLRSAVGNVSTPWVLIAFLAGARTPRVRVAAAAGFVTTCVALFGFYVWTAFVIDLGGHNYLADLRLELGANRVWFQAAVVSGPVLGMIGSWWRQRRAMSPVLAAGLFFMAEPLVLLILGQAFPGGVLDAAVPDVVRVVPGWGIAWDSGVARLSVYAAEFVGGLTLAIVTCVIPRTHRSSPA